MHRDDFALVQRLRAGDRAAFDEFFHEYHPKLYRFALRRLSNDVCAAQDAAQASICAALRSLHTYRGEATLMTWLCTICRRQIGAYARNHINVVAMREDDAEIQAALDGLIGSDRNDGLAATEAAQVQSAVLAALDYLPKDYANVLEWKYVHELSVAEIATRLGRSTKAAESLLTRSRDAFREAFEALHGARPALSSRKPT